MSAFYKSCFGAIANDETRVVIFGSLPGDESLKQRQYYAHPTNQFWRLVGSVTGQKLHLQTYANRLLALQEAGIGLWDVIASASRVGSADSAIRDHSTNSLQEFTNSLPNLKALAFNGGTPFKIGTAQLDQPRSHAIIELPSSSGGNTHMTFDQKQQAWHSIAPFLR